MSNDYEAASSINFKEKPDGTQPELSAEERRAAADAFKDLTDDLFLSHMDNVKNYKPGQILDNATSNLLLSVDNSDGSSLTVSLESSSTEEYDFMSPRSLSVQEIDTHSYGHELHTYELARDGSEVIRVDAGDIYEKMNRDRKLGKSAGLGVMDAEGMIGYVENQIVEIQNEIKNADLEKELGLNRQPVDKEEIMNLAAITRQAKPKKLY